MSLARSPYPKHVYERSARILKVMANPKRLEILNILKESGEVTVDQLSRTIGIYKANTSQHLALLRELELVKVRRVGKNAYYSITSPKIAEPYTILNQLLKT